MIWAVVRGALIGISVTIGSLAVAQTAPAFGSEETLLDKIKRYEQQGDVADLLSVQFFGSKYPSVMNWLEQRSKFDNNVLFIAAKVFSESGDSEQQRKAEALYQREFSVHKTYGAATALGDIYLFGQGVTADSKKRCEWYERAFNVNRDSISNDQYAFCMLPGIDRNFRKSEPEACRILGELSKKYSEDASLEKYFPFEAGRSYAFYGDCLLSQTAGMRQPKDAVGWFRRGAGLNHAYSTYRLAQELEEGVGVLRDTQAAVKAYTKAAELGAGAAQNYLGILHAEGRMVSKNLVEAYKWFLIAASNGYDNARDNRKSAEAKLSPSEIRAAENSARQWQVKFKQP